MTTIKATQDGPRVALLVSPTTSISQITRVDANGSTTLRVPPGTFPRTAPLQMFDWEVSLQGPVNYYAGDGAAGVIMTLDRPWLVAPLRPSRSLQLEQVTDYASSQNTLGTLHQVIDRPDPLAALGRLTTRTGVLDIYCPDYATYRARTEALDLAGIMMLKTPDQPGMDMYFIPTSASVRPADGAFMLSVGYTEVLRPASPITESDWTLASIAASYGSLATISQSYEDFEGLALNDQTGVNL